MDFKCGWFIHTMWSSNRLSLEFFSEISPKKKCFAEKHNSSTIQHFNFVIFCEISKLSDNFGSDKESFAVKKADFPRNFHNFS